MADSNVIGFPVAGADASKGDESALLRINLSSKPTGKPVIVDDVAYPSVKIDELQDDDWDNILYVMGTMDLSTMAQSMKGAKDTNEATEMAVASRRYMSEMITKAARSILPESSMPQAIFDRLTMWHKATVVKNFLAEHGAMQRLEQSPKSSGLTSEPSTQPSNQSTGAKRRHGGK